MVAFWVSCKKLTPRCRTQGAPVPRQVPPALPIITTALIGCMRSVLKTPSKLVLLRQPELQSSRKMHCVAHFAEETCAERPANGDLETP